MKNFKKTISLILAICIFCKAVYCSSSLMLRHAALTLAAAVIFSIVDSFPAHKPVRCAGGKPRPRSSLMPQ